MTFLNASRLLVSLPAAEIVSLDLPGSVMSAEQVSVLPVSHALASALSLLRSHCHMHGIETRYLARPEIFMHGAPAAWLRKHLAGFTEHLCLTDGSTVKHVEACRTHMFLYRLAQYDSYLSLARLHRRAPELLAQVQSQVNTRFAWRESDPHIQPDPVYLDALAPSPALPPALFYPFQMQPYHFENTAQCVLAATPLALADLPAAAHTIYMPLTGTSLHDPAFVRAAAQLIRAVFHRSGTQLLLRLPNDQHDDSLATDIIRVLAALAASGVMLPRNVPRNIFFVSGDLAAAPGPGRLTVMLHEGFDFWRHDKGFYDMADEVEVLASAEFRDEPQFLPLDVTLVLGPRASRQWLAPARRPDRI